MSDRKTIRVHLALDFEVAAGLADDQLQPLIEKELDELKSASGAYGAQILDAEIRDIEPGDGLQNYTVVLFVDADKAVERFTEEVRAKSESEAYDLAVEQAKESGCSSSGHSIADYEWEHATEIATFRGHNLSEYQMSRIRLEKEIAADPNAPKIGDKIVDGDREDLTVTKVPAVFSRPLENGVWMVFGPDHEPFFIRRVEGNWVALTDDEREAAGVPRKRCGSMAGQLVG